jgi:hypothetical protein
MTKNKWWLLIIATIFVITTAVFYYYRNRPISAATRKPLAEYITSLNFTPFTLPNNVIGPMSIFEFHNGRETIVADKADCFPKTDYSTSDTAVEVYEQEVRSAAEFNSVIDKRYLENSDLDYVFSDKNVKSVKITLTNPRILYFSKLKATQLAESASLDCRTALAERRNVVVHAVLVADGIKVSLVGQANGQAKLSASASAGVQAKADFAQDLQQSGELTVANRTLYYGYRPFQVTLLPGVVGPGVDVEELKGDQAKERIKQARELGQSGANVESDRAHALAVWLRLYEPQVAKALQSLKQIDDAAIQRTLAELKVIYTQDETPFAFYANPQGTKRIFVSLGGLNMLDVAATAHAISQAYDSRRDWWFKFMMFYRQLSAKAGAVGPDPMAVAGLSPKDVSPDTIMYQDYLLGRLTTFVVAHELGHLMLNHDGNKKDMETIEAYQERLFAQELAADAFAVEQVQRLGYSPFIATYVLLSHLLIFGNERSPDQATHPPDTERLKKIVEFYRNKKEQDDDTAAIEKLIQLITDTGPAWTTALDEMARDVTLESLNITGKQLQATDMEAWISAEAKKQLLNR